MCLAYLQPVSVVCAQFLDEIDDILAFSHFPEIPKTETGPLANILMDAGWDMGLQCHNPQIKSPLRRGGGVLPLPAPLPAQSDWLQANAADATCVAHGGQGCGCKQAGPHLNTSEPTVRYARTLMLL